MPAQPVDRELLDTMILAEIAMKYGCFSQAINILSDLILKIPNYLPAKEALQKIYRETGESEQANQLEQEMNQIRSQLAAERSQRLGVSSGNQKREFIARIDSIVREIYDTREYEEVLKVSASKLLETIPSDRCLIWIHESANWKESRYEYCGKGVPPCPWEKIKGLNAILWQLVSNTQETLAIEKISSFLLLAPQKEILELFSIQSILACPLTYKSSPVGLITIHRCQPESSWSDEAISLLSTVAGHTAVALRNAWHFNEAQTRELKDQLTGLVSPQFFEERLAVETRNASQQNYPLCLGLIYVNDFQNLLAAEGRIAAETVLHKVGFLIKTHVRKGSVVGRTAHEEFGVILPDAARQQAQQILNNIKEIVENTIATESGKPVTVGVGVIEATPNHTPWNSLHLSEAEARQSMAAVYRSHEDNSAFRGNFSEIEFVDVLQILANGNKTGKLMMTAEGHIGIIFFNAGKIVDAIFRGKRREQAFYEILTIKKASFEFQSSTLSFDEHITVSNTHLILEGLRLLDEANHERHLTITSQ